MKKITKLLLTVLITISVLPVVSVFAEGNELEDSEIAATLFATEDGIEPLAEMDCGNYSDGIHRMYRRGNITIWSTSNEVRWTNMLYFRCACGYALATFGDPLRGAPIYYYFELDTVGWYDGADGAVYRTDAEPFYTESTTLPCIRFFAN